MRAPPVLSLFADAGNAEVEDLCLAFEANQHVVRRDVLVDDATGRREGDAARGEPLV